jgi:uncharacterized damage-inducible protein DinB
MATLEKDARLASVVDGDLVRYYRHLASRVETAARSLPREKFWAKPFAFGNSVGHLVLHLTGNLNHYIGALVAGTGYVRDRPREFTDPAGYPPEEVMRRFRETVEMVCTTIESLDAEGLMTPVAEQPPVETRFGLLLLCAAHMNNHIGQMSYLVQVQGHSTNEPPIW